MTSPVKDKSNNKQGFSDDCKGKRGPAGGMQTNNERGIGDTDHCDGPCDKYQ